MDKEIWKDVVGYEGLYEVSNFGNVRSVVRYRNYINKQTQQPSVQVLGGHLFKGSYNKDGYHTVTLTKNGEVKTWGVHRLVASAFIQNTDNKPFIDHINTLRYDNRVDNLRWVDYSENAGNIITLQKYNAYNSQFRSCGNAHTRARANKKRGVCVGTYSTKLCLTNKSREGVFIKISTLDDKKICDFGVSYDSLVVLKEEIEKYLFDTKKTSLLM